MFEVPGLALLAVSGGPDSIALLNLMQLVAPQFGLSLAVAHVEHGIQPVTARVPDAVSQWAELHGMPCHIARLGLGGDASETKARIERYGALRSIQVQEGARYLVTAHHRNDQIETVLYRFLRGSGVFGLAGIPGKGPRGLVRPLLPFTRSELVDWLDSKYRQDCGRPGLFCDPANEDQKHDRAWIRHTVLPLLRQRSGVDLEDRLLSVAYDADLQRSAWSAALRSLPELRLRVADDCVEVARAALQRYDKMLSLVLLRAAAREVGCRLGRRRAAELLTFATDGSSGRVLQLGSGWEAELVFGDLLIKPETPAGQSVAADLESGWGVGEGGCVHWPGWEFRWRVEPAAAIQRCSLTTWVTPGAGGIRVPRAGDKMLPLGGVGRRKVRRLLMEGRVPTRDRHRYPVVVRRRDIIWIPGICRSAASVPSVGDPAVRLDARATGH